MAKEWLSKFNPQSEQQTGIKPGNNYDIWRLRPFSIAEFNLMPKEKQYLYLIHLAHMSASTHNTQPWAFRIDSDKSQISAFLNRDRVLQGSDIIGRQALTSMGWAIANLDVASKFFGFAPEIHYEAVDPVLVKPYSRFTNKDIHLVPIARINLKKYNDISTEHPGLFEAIFTRRVDRCRYDTTVNIDVKILEVLTKIPQAGINLHLLKRGNWRIARIAELQGAADGFVANNPEFARELGDWMKPVDTHDYVGMPGDTFNLTSEQTDHIIEGFRDKEQANTDTTAGFIRGSRKGIESAAVVGLLTVSENNPRNWVQSGRILGKIGLFLESKGISMAIHAGLAEAGEFNFQLVTLSLPAMVLKPKEKPVVLFRAGYLEKNSSRPPHSPRLPIEQILV